MLPAARAARFQSAPGEAVELAVTGPGGPPSTEAFCFSDAATQLGSVVSGVRVAKRARRGSILREPTSIGQCRQRRATQRDHFVPAWGTLRTSMMMLGSLSRKALDHQGQMLVEL